MLLVASMPESSPCPPPVRFSAIFLPLRGQGQSAVADSQSPSQAHPPNPLCNFHSDRKLLPKCTQKNSFLQKWHVSYCSQSGGMWDGGSMQECGAGGSSGGRCAGGRGGKHLPPASAALGVLLLCPQPSWSRERPHVCQHGRKNKPLAAVPWWRWAVLALAPC